MTWDDYRLVLVLARCGRIPDAAEALGVTVSTVFRHLERIEGQLKEPVFFRDRGDYQANELGTEIVLAAERMEQEVRRIARLSDGRDQQIQGKVTITATEVLAPFFLARHVSALLEQHPALEVQIVSSNQVLSLENREADIALRPMRPSDEALFGRKLTEMRWARYRACTSEAPAGSRAGTGEDYTNTLFLEKDRNAYGLKSRFQSNSLLSTAALVASGSGEAVLPMILGEQWSGLQRTSEPIVENHAELWIVCHSDVRRNARVRVVFDAMIKAAAQDRRLFLGDI
ncbi:LysR family transcriptional regulator [Roseibium sp.]|uniref:LysR family transcriptional regulator n=1 Tax=Roseibium sp. TaxID=1936156 RepID=UPI003D0AA39A